ncbi:hypothetical protein [Sphingomonas aracearum]|uniref:Transferrin-binding protein B C-lobe/N-lobe beta barrel domain-containing protein n=1 Tax=Sphingomonas aracearum TaxID=2283317 RepID=A0A369VTV0_9SPHN|nr:hypothetical protein [Sphingomonas aracearum]RDE05814.1 hypothetical protein DVW87_11510 [Sphingomonas aracearum]
MRGLKGLPLAAFVLLGACGGGGGGVGSAGSGAPGSGGGTTPAPAPANTNIAALTANQTFAASAASTVTAINTSPAQVVNAAASRAPLQVRYDAATRSYTVESQGRTASFGPADAVTSTRSGEALYAKPDGSVRDYLTLATTPYTNTTPNRYVGLGFWQRNTVSTGRQDTSFDSFVYGLETPAGAVPRTGTASYVTDALGFVTTPGKVPRAFTGPGSFDVDLAQGIFATHAYVLEYDLTSPETRTGGGIDYTAGGRLTAGNGFSGNFTYGGTDTRVSGTLVGQFFGPGAEEIGATFSGDNAAGAAVSGSLTGQRLGGAARSNLSLVNLTTEQLFYARESNYTLQNGYGGVPFASTYQGIAQLTLRPDGSVSATGAISTVPYAQFTAANRVEDGRASFITYQGSVDGQPGKLSLYRPGPANPELQLTYASFGIWEGGSTVGYGAFNGKAYRAYGIETPRDLLTRRTGTATYAGVVYATGVRGGSREFDVGGTSSFAVDFGAQRFSGALALTDKGAGGAQIGNWSFADALAYGLPISTALRSGTEAQGTIVPTLFGPDGEEMAASFLIRRNTQTPADALVITGATVAKRQ